MHYIKRSNKVHITFPIIPTFLLVLIGHQKRAFTQGVQIKSAIHIAELS